jgi:hypothetical protein
MRWVGESWSRAGHIAMVGAWTWWFWMSWATCRSSQAVVPLFLPALSKLYEHTSVMITTN